MILFHVIGLFIFLSDDRPQGLSWVNIFLCGLLLFLASGDYKKELLVLALLYPAGFLVEWIGVGTGLLFGEYHYGTELGATLGGVPLIMGLNWYCVIVIACAVLERIGSQLHVVIKSLLAGVFCALLDVLIEPVAIAYNFWQWDGGEIPVYNYICWGILAALFAGFVFKMQRPQNKLAWYLTFIWLIFFGILNLT